MAETVMAMTQTGANEMEMREYAMPEVPVDGAILKMEAVGICGSDVGAYARSPKSPKILGHENVGRIHMIGSSARRMWSLDEGDLVALEEYLVCHQCEWCHRGEYRHCWATDTHNNPDPLRYGGTSIEREPALWGGYSQYLYMPYESVWHRVPEGLTPSDASLHIALGNGVQWACLEGGVGAGKSVLIQGPGQMGSACVVASKAAGAELIIVSGLTSDRDRLEVCERLGADVTIDVERDDIRERVKEATGGKGVDTVVDTTARAGLEPTFIAIDVLRTRGGTMVVQGGKEFPNFPMNRLSDKYITLKQCRGHSYAAVERGLQIMASGRFPLELMHTKDYPLAEAASAVRATAGELIDGKTRALHVSIRPWM
ncbi:MAG: zinc-binding dehydrogenase [Acidimicrobiaceae bacterium]|nr:zinc-binding dehydrogenase [Acidimicrobiaceae bacterium]